MDFLCNKSKPDNKSIRSSLKSTASGSSLFHSQETDFQFYESYTMDQNEKFKMEYFLEKYSNYKNSIAKILVDFSLNEFKVFFINSTEITVENYYLSLEYEIISILE